MQNAPDSVEQAQTLTPEAKVHQVAIVGFGTVGRSVAKILCERKLSNLRLTHVFNRNVERKKIAGLGADVTWTDRIEDIMDSGVDMVVELLGGLDPAESWVRTALKRGKSVVTANKQLMAHYGADLLALARGQGRCLYFGASVAGGVPVLSGLQEGLAGDRLYRVCGILNGTCNYILGKVESSGISFETALREAQEAGFAETDPTDDIEGYDARAKITILAYAGLATHVRTEEVECRSIREIDGIDFAYAHQLNCTIRQISRAEIDYERLLASVEPTLVFLDSPLAKMQGVRNLVTATGEYGGETVFSGYGAGGDPTAVAVVSDLLAIAQADHKPNFHAQVPAIDRPVSSDFAVAHYVRFTVNDRPGIIADLGAIFGKHGLNIDSVLQQAGFARERLSFVITLEKCSASTMRQALEEIAALDFHVEPPLALPIFGE